MPVFYELYFNIIKDSVKKLSFIVNGNHLQVKNSVYAFIPGFLDSWIVEKSSSLLIFLMCFLTILIKELIIITLI